jgi:hypothetical protein
MQQGRPSSRIAFVGHFLYNSGSSNALLGYSRAAQRLGYDLRLSPFSIADEIVRAAVPVANSAWEADLTVIVLESYQFLAPDALVQLERSVPRKRRLIIDPDGKYSPPTHAGRDTNHPTADSYSFWTDFYNRLSDVILQPCIGQPNPPVRAFLYFAVDENRPQRFQASDAAGKPYSLVYVGNNWYRWDDLVWLIRSLTPIRSRLDRIALFGKWWDGNNYPEYPWQTYSDPSFLHAHAIECYPSVAYGLVERTMSLGQLSPVFVRPILNALQLATPRMFETFAAPTVPLLPPYMTYYGAIFGPSAKDLCLPSNPVAKVEEILDNYTDYLALARDIGSALALKHSYERRITEMLDLMS